MKAGKLQLIKTNRSMNHFVEFGHNAFEGAYENPLFAINDLSEQKNSVCADMSDIS